MICVFIVSYHNQAAEDVVPARPIGDGEILKRCRSNDKIAADLDVNVTAEVTKAANRSINSGTFLRLPLRKASSGPRDGASASNASNDDGGVQPQPLGETSKPQVLFGAVFATAIQAGDAYDGNDGTCFRRRMRIRTC